MDLPSNLQETLDDLEDITVWSIAEILPVMLKKEAHYWTLNIQMQMVLKKLIAEKYFIKYTSNVVLKLNESKFIDKI